MSFTQNNHGMVIRFARPVRSKIPKRHLPSDYKPVIWSYVGNGKRSDGNGNLWTIKHKFAA